jgi:threonine/homoserine/homoserine lactone efflux protein
MAMSFMVAFIVQFIDVAQAPLAMQMLLLGATQSSSGAAVLGV